MAIRLSEVRAKVTETTVEWDGETAKVGFYPARVTPALLESVQEAAKHEDLNVLGVMLEPVLAFWEVQDDDDQNLPTDADTIRTMPLGFLTKVMSEVQAVMRPPESRG